MARTAGFPQVRGLLPQPMRYRIALASVVVVSTLIKLWVAAHTFGTGDVRTWSHYAAGVAKAGPIGVYGLKFETIYNHPPLIGYMLMAVNAATRHGLGFPFAIRIPAIAADVATPFIVVGLLRRRRSPLEAFAAAASVAASPVLFVISGFHGNTDPIFVMFTLLSVYLLVDRNTPALGGLAIAIALSVKIIPFVVLPTLLVFAFLSGRRTFLRFVAASSSFLAAIWGPVLLRECPGPGR